jgi:hypothetical protein
MFITRPKRDVAEGPSAPAAGLFVSLQGTYLAGCFVSLSSALLTVVWSIQYSRPTPLASVLCPGVCLPCLPRHVALAHILLNSFDVIPVRMLRPGGGSGTASKRSPPGSPIELECAFTAFLQSLRAIGESRTQLVVCRIVIGSDLGCTFVFLWLRGGSQRWGRPTCKTCWLQPNTPQPLPACVLRPFTASFSWLQAPFPARVW